MIVFGILILLGLFWLLQNRTLHLTQNPSRDISANNPGPTNRMAVSPTIGISTNVSTPAGATSASANYRIIDTNQALSSLIKWIKQRDRKDVVVVDAQPVNDLSGNPASLNVLVTSKAGGLTAENLKAQLTDMARRERTLKDQLHVSYQKTDIAAVNQLVAEFSQARTAFVASNEVAAYKVSLIKDRPPVLSYWEGLSFETVREDEARRLAATKLGADPGLQGYLHYTSVTSLLCFTNGTGSRVFIDPYRMAEVPLAVLQLPHNGAQTVDTEKEARIAAQWENFLTP